jgi:hypothetical protein
LHSFNGFSSTPKRARVHLTDNHTSRKGRPRSKSDTPREKSLVSFGTNTSLPGCPGDKCLYHSDNPRTWTVEEVGEYIAATDCKNYATYFMDQVGLFIQLVVLRLQSPWATVLQLLFRSRFQEIDGESLLMLTRSTLMQFTKMKLGPTLKLSNYIAQLRARVGMSKCT